VAVLIISLYLYSFSMYPTDGFNAEVKKFVFS